MDASDSTWRGARGRVTVPASVTAKFRRKIARVVAYVLAGLLTLLGVVLLGAILFVQGERLATIVNGVLPEMKGSLHFGAISWKPRLLFDLVTDRATPINLTSHAYFNLAGGGDVLDHELWLAAARYTPTDDALIPTGQIAPVKGTPVDFTTPARIGARIAQLNPKLGGYDHNFVLDGEPGQRAAVRYPPAQCRAPRPPPVP